MLSGRVAFSLGLAVGLLAVVALLRSRPVAAVLLALLTSLASPVAGAFLALVGVADALTGRRGRGLAIAAAALAPIALFALAFPEGGWEPFAASVFWPNLAGVVLIALLAATGTRPEASVSRRRSKANVPRLRSHVSAATEAGGHPPTAGIPVSASARPPCAR